MPLLTLRSPCCPDCETLAAFIDSGLGFREQRDVLRHLAWCPSCVGLVAGVVRTLVELMEDSARGRKSTEPANY